MPSHIEMAKRVLAADNGVGIGLLLTTSNSPDFPPRAFLNEFLMHGSDPCIQERWGNEWPPFTLSADEYHEVLAWWGTQHPGAVENALDAKCWDDWLDVVLNR